MRLRYLVPALAFSATTCPLFAVEISKNLVIDGYVDTVLGVTSNKDDTAADFSAAAQLEPIYRLSDKVKASMELYRPDDEAIRGAGPDIELQQAKIDVELFSNKDVKVSGTMGKFEAWIGLEGYDAPDLSRVNFSQFSQIMTAGPVTGVGIGATVPMRSGEDEYIRADLFVVENGVYNGVYGFGDGRQDNDRMAIGGDLTGSVKFFDCKLMLDADVTYDMHATNSATSKGKDVFGIDFNGTFNLPKSLPLMFGFDVGWIDYDDASAFGVMGMVGYDTTSTFESIGLGGFDSKVTLMADYVDPNDEVKKDQVLEVAAAFLTNPVKGFGINLEVRYLDYQDNDMDDIGVFLEMLAVIP